MSSLNQIFDSIHSALPFPLICWSQKPQKQQNCILKRKTKWDHLASYQTGAFVKAKNSITLGPMRPPAFICWSTKTTKAKKYLASHETACSRTSKVASTLTPTGLISNYYQIIIKSHHQSVNNFKLILLSIPLCQLQWFELKSTVTTCYKQKSFVKEDLG